jgi:hypothetical protein
MDTTVSDFIHEEIRHKISIALDDIDPADPASEYAMLVELDAMLDGPAKSFAFTAAQREWIADELDNSADILDDANRFKPNAQARREARELRRFVSELRTTD